MSAERDSGLDIPTKGLLRTSDTSFRSWRFVTACLAEFIGVMIFTFYGSSVPTSVNSTSVSTAVTATTGATSASSSTILNNAFGNGLTLAVLLYVTANVSGGHLNPAVTIATWITGHISFAKGVCYIIMQVAGALVGSVLLVGMLHPTADWHTTTGCFSKTGINGGQLFGWEAIMTFLLVLTIYAVAIGEPSFGNVGPLIIGLALVCSVEAGGAWTAGALNPARAIAPALVYGGGAGCVRGQTWIYVLGEILGACVAGIISVPLYGRGPDFGHFFGHDFNRKTHKGIIGKGADLEEGHMDDYVTTNNNVTTESNTVLSNGATNAAPAHPQFTVNRPAPVANNANAVQYVTR